MECCPLTDGQVLQFIWGMLGLLALLFTLEGISKRKDDR